MTNGTVHSRRGARDLFAALRRRRAWRVPRLRAALALFALLAQVVACAEGGSRYEIDPGVAQRPLPGPATPVDVSLARAGAAVFQDRCVACHKLGPGVAVGPDLSGVANRREPEWIRGMVLNPDSMLRVDSTARALLAEYQVPMIDPGLGEPEFRALLEFLRSDGGRRRGVGPGELDPALTAGVGV